MIMVNIVMFTSIFTFVTPGKPRVPPGSFGKTCAILGTSRSHARSKIIMRIMTIVIMMTLIMMIKHILFRYIPEPPLSHSQT